MMICPSLTGRLCKKLIIATGHGMLGLTMATGTGKAVCDMMQKDQRGGIQTDSRGDCCSGCNKVSLCRLFVFRDR